MYPVHWFGGFAGGILSGLAVMHWKRLPKIADDYGRPSHLPWAIAFPKGLPPTSIPVHPTQLYEAAALVPLAWLLVRWRRHKRADRFVLGGYLFLAGAIRFLIEFLRVDVRVVGIFSVAHLASLSAMALGIGFLWSSDHGTPGDAVAGS